MKRRTWVLLLLMFLALGLTSPANGQAGNARISLLGRDDQPLSQLVDGNMVRLRIELPSPVNAEMRVDFLLFGVALPVGGCTVTPSQSTCESEAFASLGWYWGADGGPQPQRLISAIVNGIQAEGSLTVNVIPRPVVMVHGFNADFHTWDSYLGPQGYLVELGLRGFAVGDGQVSGVMKTGSFSDPFTRTNSIAQNAGSLSKYIDNVQEVTGAEQIDLLVHSMGGMISRYYLDRLMIEDDVAQLIILGTPMAGSSCAALPAALGMMLPATLEIQPGYMVGVFNQQIFRRQGVPFHALAGTKLLDAVQSPCTPVPSDVVVTVDSVKAIPMPVEEIALLHTELNTSRSVFDEFVTPLLKTPPGEFEALADPPAGSNAPLSNQFSRIFTGHIDQGETRELVIPIDANVTVANFALFDSSRSLEIAVTGASGNQIALDPTINGLVRVDDPSTMIYLGYGFNRPNPGQWIVTLRTTASTPPSGADFALAAQFNGGAQLQVSQDKTIPRLGEAVNIRAALTAAGAPVPLQTARLILRKPDGSVETLEMNIEGHEALLTVRPFVNGIYGLEIDVTARSTDGFLIDRAAFLNFEVQPSVLQTRLVQILVICGLALIVVFSVFLVVLLRRRRA
ncbi:MAG: alpha/beta fold hydrolase [Bacteroidetes bacterium]|nr:alpha/beta fold hydrolase [Bacteroidota bacterium]